MAFDRAEGFGGPLLEMLIGILAAYTVNSSQRAPDPPIQPGEIMPHYEQPPEDVWGKFQEWKAHRGTSGTD